MTALFATELHDEFGGWALAYIPYGGAEFGELQTIAAAVGSGDDDAFYQAWVSFGDRLVGEAQRCVAQGHETSARELYLRASAYYALAYHPLYGAPVDQRLLDGFDKQVRAFDAGLALGPEPVAPVRIPYQDTTLPAYLIPAVGHAHDVRPLIIFTNGYDATITDMYFASAVAAARRGYHCLLFDGPGQGEMLYRHKVPMRPDWEHVITPVVDWAVQQPTVDTARIVLSGWSLGGYLAPRGASGEHRLAAVIADPGQWNIGDSMKALGVTNPDTIDQHTIDALIQVIDGTPAMRWRIKQRGFWVNGVTNLRDLITATLRYTLGEVGTNISCPLLVTAAENDPLARGATQFVETLRSQATLVRFTAAEGAGGHCEMANRTLLNRRVLDWLDDTLQQSANH